MYFTYNKTTYRLLGSTINGIIMAGFGMNAIGLTIGLILMIINGTFQSVIVAPLILFWSETIFTARTFAKGVTTGPNSALWNLPLLYTDFCLLIYASNTIILMGFDIFGYGDFIRTLLFVFVILRYIGLAWTNPNFFLKRLVCPIREDKAVEASAFF